MSDDNNHLPLQFIPQTGGLPTGVFIFLHGLGKTGEWQKEQFYSLMGEQTQFPHIKIIFPSARFRFCKYRGSEMHSWFATKEIKDSEKYELHLDAVELEDSLNYVDNIVEDVVATGVPRHRIIVGGVSQGGVLALLYGYYKQNTNVKGIISLSAFYPQLYMDRFRQNSQHLPELLCANFKEDPIIPYDISRAGYDFLKSKNIRIEEHNFSCKEHNVNGDMLITTYHWILKMIPERDST